MAEKFSTGLRNAVMGDRSFRELMADAIINIYDGAAPSSPNDAKTGTLLATITRASGAVVANAFSYSEVANIVIGSHAVGEIFALSVTIDGVGPTEYTFTNTPDAGDVDAVAKMFARVLNAVPGLFAFSTGAGGYIALATIPGNAMTVANGGSLTGTQTTNDGVIAAADLNTLRFDAPVLGVISKAAAHTWSGLGLADGAAGYWRLVLPDDDGTLSTTQKRVQGNCSTSGGDMILSSLAVRIGAVVGVASFNVTFPES